MDRTSEHQSPRFAVGAEFNMKHFCYSLWICALDAGSNARLKWHFYATSISDTDVWQVRTSIQNHSCTGINGLGHSNIDEEFISIEILPKLLSDLSFAPKAIQNHLKDTYGVEISYAKAYRGKERALKLINGSHEEAYQCLPKYCNEILRSNPGSTAELEINPETNQFKRLFISFAGSAMGFAYCRPVLGLDGTHLKHKYQGALHAKLSNSRDSSRCHCNWCKWMSIPSCACGCRCGKWW